MNPSVAAAWADYCFGIEPGPTVPFNSLMELPAKIEKVLIDGITPHLVGRNEKYLEA